MTKDLWTPTGNIHMDAASRPLHTVIITPVKSTPPSSIDRAVRAVKERMGISIE